jgi:hypothetical protein
MRAVCIGDRLNDDEPESEARGRPTIRRAAPLKRLEEGRQLVGGIESPVFSIVNRVCDLPQPAVIAIQPPARLWRTAFARTL